MDQRQRHEKFHGRVAGTPRPCSMPGCPNRGEFRAPGEAPSGFDGPGQYRWFCLDHVRAFNASYDWFAGMSADEIDAAQRPIAGWETESRAFRAAGSPDVPPVWSDFRDPLDAIAARFRSRRPVDRSDGKPLSPEDRTAMKTLGLETDATRHDLRARYSALVRTYHPDRNGGDRSHERRLQAVVEAYQHLRRSLAFA